MESYLHYLQDCRQGNLDKVQKNFLHSYQQEAFQIACDNGKLDVAQWLYYQGGIIDCNQAFKITCYNGNLDVAQWLYSLGNIDISRDDYFCLRYAEKNNHQDTVKWLRSIMY
jgi:hypothetical protein